MRVAAQHANGADAQRQMNARGSFATLAGQFKDCHAIDLTMKTGLV